MFQIIFLMRIGWESILQIKVVEIIFLLQLGWKYFCKQGL